MTEAIANMNALRIVYTSWMLNIYNLYFSPTPALVTLKRFVNTTSYEIENVDVPNLAMHKANIITASGIVPGEVTQVGDSGGGPLVEIIPDTPDVMDYEEGCTAWDIDVYAHTEGVLDSISVSKIKVVIMGVLVGADMAFGIKEAHSDDLVGWLEWGISGTDSYTGSLVASGSSATPKLHLFVRHELNLDPAVTTHFSCAVRKTVIH